MQHQHTTQPDAVFAMKLCDRIGSVITKMNTGRPILTIEVKLEACEQLNMQKNLMNKPLSISHTIRRKFNSYEKMACYNFLFASLPQCQCSSK